MLDEIMEYMGDYFSERVAKHWDYKKTCEAANEAEINLERYLKEGGRDALNNFKTQRNLLTCATTTAYFKEGFRLAIELLYKNMGNCQHSC